MGTWDNVGGEGLYELVDGTTKARLRLSVGDARKNCLPAKICIYPSSKSLAVWATHIFSFPYIYNLM